MKRNDHKRQKRYHNFIVQDEIKQAHSAANTRIKRKLKEATRDLGVALSLNDEVVMKDSKQKSSRSHMQTMKKKIRKWKKTTDIYMDLDTTS